MVGGGATGLGVAVDAASRGYRTALLEAEDFAKATSSRSTKLVHGGVRYLEQMDISLVTEALRERGIFYRNAPHIVRDLPFIVPRYKWWEGPFYGAGPEGVRPAGREVEPRAEPQCSIAEETIAEIPNVETEGSSWVGFATTTGSSTTRGWPTTLAMTAADHGAAVAHEVPGDRPAEGG